MYTEYQKRELEARNKAIAEFRAVLDTAEAEKRDTTPEEDERVAKFEAEVSVHEERMAQLSRMADAEKRTAEYTALLGGEDRPKGGEALTGQALLLNTIRTHQRAIIAGGDKAGEVNLVLPFNMREIHEVATEVRAIADFSDSAKLYVSDFSTKVALYQRTVSPWIKLAEVINADNGRPLILPNSTVDPTSYTPGEGTAITESTPTLGTATATPVSYKALSYVSAEAEEDELIGLMALIAKQQGRSLGLAFGTAATAAVLAGGTNGGTASGVGGDGTATVTFFGYEDLLDLKYGAAAPYRMVGVWVMSNGAIKKVRKYKDSNKQYYWQPAIAEGQPDTFDGQAVYEDPGLAAPASATKSVVYGDPTSFVIKQRALRVAVSTDFKFDTDQVALKSVYRAAGAVADAPGLRFLVSANT